MIGKDYKIYGRAGPSIDQIQDSPLRGEEYCLLFTANLTTKELETLNQVTTCYNIGEVQKGDGVFLDNGQNIKSLPNEGWQS